MWLGKLGLGGRCSVRWVEKNWVCADKGEELTLSHLLLFSVHL